MDPFDDLDRARKGRKALSIAAIFALLLFVAFAVFPNLLGTNDVPPEYDGQVAAIVVEREGVEPPFALSAGDAIETFEVFGGKNPFTRPLSLPSSIPTTVPGGDPDAPTTTPDSTPGATPTIPDAPTPSQQAPVRGQAVALLDVYDDAEGTKAQIRVGSTAYLVAEGDVFAVSYKVVSLDLATGCGQFLFGDSSFDLCKGQEILK